MGFPILVICEGASEVNYIQHLNRILCSAEGRSVFVPRDANGGAPKKILSLLRREQKHNRGMTKWIFLDEDIYCRDPNLKLALQQKQGNALIHFNRMNFEDVVMLHEPYPRLMEWVQLCRQLRHFTSPLSEEEYLLHFKKFFPNYHKRELPFELTNTRLEQAFFNLKNQKDIQSSLLSSIEMLLDSKEINRRFEAKGVSL